MRGDSGLVEEKDEEAKSTGSVGGTSIGTGLNGPEKE
jgi:hypothetical protein